MRRLGLTGSIGMGKSTTAAMFAEEGIPVWDADAAVHRLYAAGADGAVAIGGLVSQALDQSGAVDRGALRAAIAENGSLLSKVEAAIHPLVAADRAAFAAEAAATGASIVLFDIPLLFETGGDGTVDSVVVVTAPEKIQRERVLDRGTMTAAELDAIVARQMPDAEKRARADHVIDTSKGFEAARKQVREILEEERNA
ncbi:MAG: dephospho-CoA kinase [Pseudomonadota bacterium]